MPRNRLALTLISVGVVLAIPAALVLISFEAQLSEAGTLIAAPVCAAPTQDGISNCLSEFGGTITAVTPHSKSEDHVTLAVGSASYDLGYDCAESPAGACGAILFKPGTPIVAGWWRGKLVAFGAAESRPSVVTELHPLDQARPLSVVLDFLLIPAVSLVAGGLMLRQAPMTIDDLVRSALSKWPDPPRAVDKRLIWRVAIGYWAPYGLLAWFFVSVFESMAVIGFSAYALALPLLVATFVLTMAASALIASNFLSGIVRSSDRRDLTVPQIKTGLGRSGKDTLVSYELLNGKTATRTLDFSWNGLVKVGDRLDALTDPKSGAIVRLLSTPPAQA